MDPSKAFCDSILTYNSRVRYGPRRVAFGRKKLYLTVLFETSVICHAIHPCLHNCTNGIFANPAIAKSAADASSQIDLGKTKSREILVPMMNYCTHAACISGLIYDHSAEWL